MGLMVVFNICLAAIISACLFLPHGCGTASPTAAESDWQIVETDALIPVTKWTLCGETPCVSQGITHVRGYTDLTTRTIYVWKAAPPAVLQWERCNAERFDQTGVVADRGCPP